MGGEPPFRKLACIFSLVKYKTQHYTASGEFEVNGLHPSLPKLPPRIASLPIDDRGYPVPWFVAWVNGKPEFRCIDARKMAIAVEQSRCWICGEELGKYVAFVIGPMCAINHISSEPPSHRECAEFSARACPFLTKPKVVRREEGVPEDAKDAAGYGLKRNPGVALVWITKSCRIFNAYDGNDGILFEIGPAEECLWFREGRSATRQEVLDSIDSGLPLLRKPAEQEGEESVKELERRYQVALELLPAT